MSEDNQLATSLEQQLAEVQKQQDVLNTSYEEMLTRFGELREKIIPLRTEWISQLEELVRRELQGTEDEAFEQGDIVEDEFGVRYRVYEGRKVSTLEITYAVESYSNNYFRTNGYAADPRFAIPVRPPTQEDAVKVRRMIQRDARARGGDGVFGIRLTKTGIEAHGQPRRIGSPHLKRVDPTAEGG